MHDFTKILTYPSKTTYVYWKFHENSSIGSYVWIPFPQSAEVFLEGLECMDLLEEVCHWGYV